MKSTLRRVPTQEDAVFNPVSRLASHRFTTPPLSAKLLRAEIARLQDVLAHQQSMIEGLSRLAHHDALTGVLNRRGFDAAMDAVFHDVRRYGHRAALLFIDINHFKAINDTYGHALGDAVLRHVAETLRAALRDTDVMARLGGDEFAILLREVDSDTATAKAKALAARLAQLPCVVGDFTIPVSASIGVAVVGEAETLPELLGLADARMYVAKVRR